eukprot:TRINITY_DN2400_c0_g1_i1.p1 TRINITY_DN2400_c0_g1~~TRINITY_DN2400_c0_g1_i1.p1  ORF type:complete len:842 (+),score=148.31 TRINITY_DN2400_c0_g1_i1:61-2526(+)
MAAVPLPGMGVKRTLCRFWAQGLCTKGDGCGFAHGELELGQAAPEESFVQKAAAPAIKRTMCKFFLEGHCRSGASCGFAHHEDELGSFVGTAAGYTPPSGAATPRSLAAHAGTSAGYTPPAGAASPRSFAAPAEKRTICKFWQEGSCARGDACGFAHGEGELGQLAPPVETAKGAGKGGEKRTVCKFWLEGRCRNGNACSFIHDENGELNEEEADAFFMREVASLQKRTICKFYLEGTCDRGDQCGFAHGEHELGELDMAKAEAELSRSLYGSDDDDAAAAYVPPGVAEAELARRRHGSEDESAAYTPPTMIVQKRTICRFWQEGTCTRGEACTFAHSDEELGQQVEVAAVQASFAPGSKRTICKFWESGTCAKGDQCGFAHGEEELGAPAPEMADEAAYVPPGQAAAYMPPASAAAGAAYQPPATTEVKRTICKFYLQGICRDGNNCGFAHGEHDLGQPVGHAAPAARTSYQPPAHAAQEPALGPERKRTICRFFLEGTCQRGNQCGFAHGEHELGQPASDPAAFPPPAQEQSEKRTICKFWLEGTCGRGDQCGFAHGDHELGQRLEHGAGAAYRPAVQEPLENRTIVVKRVTSGAAYTPPVQEQSEKRTICKFWLEGSCGRGAQCGFAHGEHELGQHDPSAYRPPGQESGKRTICRFWLEGHCDRGSQCGFAHGEHELGQRLGPGGAVAASSSYTPPARAEAQARYQPARAGGPAAAALPAPEHYRPPSASFGAGPQKRTICKFFLQGLCRAGSSCTFAHGEHELGGPAAGAPAPEPQRVPARFPRSADSRPPLEDTRFAPSKRPAPWQEAAAKRIRSS